jgi:hypothetical protein
MAQAHFLCTLSIEQLNALSTRINEMCAPPDYRADLQEARRAIQDLATTLHLQRRNWPGQARSSHRTGRRRQSTVPGGGLMDCPARSLEQMRKVSQSAHLTSPTLAMERQWAPGDSRRQIPI